MNELLLLTAKPVTYLVNLSEKDYIRKKNKWLAKIKAWIDENNPGDLLIPFSVALEERLASLPDDAAREEELKTIATTSALGKITTAGYASLHVRAPLREPRLTFAAHPVLHLRPRRGPRVDHPRGHQGPPGCWCDSVRLMLPAASC